MKGSLALTISPPDRVTKYVALRDIFLKDCMEIGWLLKQCSKQFVLYPELDFKGRLHYHGIVLIHDQIKWYKKVMPSIKIIGFICLKELPKTKDRLNWLTYCMKEWGMTRELLGRVRGELAEPIMPSHSRTHRRKSKQLHVDPEPISEDVTEWIKKYVNESQIKLVEPKDILLDIESDPQLSEEIFSTSTN